MSGAVLHADHQQTFYYDQMPNVAEERKKFLCQLEEWMDKEYWAIVDKICALPVVVDEAAFGTCEKKQMRMLSET